MVKSELPQQLVIDVWQCILNIPVQTLGLNLFQNLCSVWEAAVISKQAERLPWQGMCLSIVKLHALSINTEENNQLLLEKHWW